MAGERQAKDGNAGRKAGARSVETISSGKGEIMAKRQVYSFEEKKYSTNSVIAAVFSVLSVLLLVGLLFVSFVLKGRANTWIGALGFCGILMAFGGLWYGFAGFKDECKSYFCSKVGTILGTVSIAGWFFIVCIGLVNM